MLFFCRPFKVAGDCFAVGSLSDVKRNWLKMLPECIKRILGILLSSITFLRNYGNVRSKHEFLKSGHQALTAIQNSSGRTCVAPESFTFNLQGQRRNSTALEVQQTRNEKIEQAIVAGRLLRWLLHH